MKLFGKAKKAPNPKEGISKMRETLEMLEKREAYLQSKINHELAEAKRFMGLKNKKGMFLCSRLQRVVKLQELVPSKMYNINDSRLNMTSKHFWHHGN